MIGAGPVDYTGLFLLILLGRRGGHALCRDPQMYALDVAAEA